MMRLRMLLVALAAIAAPAAAQAESARGFVERVYAGYARENFDPLSHIDLYFAPPLAAEIRRDSSGGEVGYLDGDPLCDCQDSGGMTSRIQSVETQGNAADAHILLDFGTSDQRNVELHLVRTKRGWRVSDVATKDEPSLLGALRKANRKH
jgi:hypothetical protein